MTDASLFTNHIRVDLSIVFPEGLTSIGMYAFHDCSSLASVVLPASVSSLDEEAFDESTLIWVDSDASVTTI